MSKKKKYYFNFLTRIFKHPQGIIILKKNKKTKKQAKFVFITVLELK